MLRALKKISIKIPKSTKNKFYTSIHVLRALCKKHALHINRYIYNKFNKNEKNDEYKILLEINSIKISDLMKNCMPLNECKNFNGKQSRIFSKSTLPPFLEIEQALECCSNKIITQLFAHLPSEERMRYENYESRPLTNMSEAVERLRSALIASCGAETKVH